MGRVRVGGTPILIDVMNHLDRHLPQQGELGKRVAGLRLEKEAPDQGEVCSIRFVHAGMRLEAGISDNGE